MWRDIHWEKNGVCDIDWKNLGGVLCKTRSSARFKWSVRVYRALFHFFSLGMVRDIVPLVIHWKKLKGVTSYSDGKSGHNLVFHYRGKQLLIIQRSHYSAKRINYQLIESCYKNISGACSKTLFPLTLAISSKIIKSKQRLKAKIACTKAQKSKQKQIKITDATKPNWNNI